MRLVLRILVYAAAVWVAVAVVDGLDFSGSVVALGVIGLVLAGVNAIVKPILKVLSLPLIILSLGLFLLVINAVSLWLTVQISESFDLGLTSSGFGATFIGAVIVSLVAWAGEMATGRR